LRASPRSSTRLSRPTARSIRSIRPVSTRGALAPAAVSRPRTVACYLRPRWHRLSLHQATRMPRRLRAPTEEARLQAFIHQDRACLKEVNPRHKRSFRSHLSIWRRLPSLPATRPFQSPRHRC
jgi:hypothetical protein